jgi:hypothetical protein
LEDEKLKEQIYLKICDAVILQYKTTSTDEVDFSTDVTNESD